MGNAVMDRKTKGGHGSHNRQKAVIMDRTGCNGVQQELRPRISDLGAPHTGVGNMGSRISDVPGGGHRPVPILTLRSYHIA